MGRRNFCSSNRGLLFPKYPILRFSTYVLLYSGLTKYNIKLNSSVVSVISEGFSLSALLIKFEGNPEGV